MWEMMYWFLFLRTNQIFWKVARKKFKSLTKIFLTLVKDLMLRSSGLQLEQVLMLMNPLSTWPSSLSLKRSKRGIKVLRIGRKIWVWLSGKFNTSLSHKNNRVMGAACDCFVIRIIIINKFINVTIATKNSQSKDKSPNFIKNTISTRIVLYLNWTPDK
jgi:hypothetical protein